MTGAERADLQHAADRDSSLAVGALVLALTFGAAAGSVSSADAPAAPVDVAHSDAARVLAPRGPANLPVTTVVSAHAGTGAS